jgi:hypothetical protein
MERKMAKIYYQKKDEYVSTALKNGIVPYNKRNFWGNLLFILTGTNFPRGYSDTGTGEVWINEDAFYIDSRDKDLVLRHELGHLEGKEHTMFGLMCPYGILRYLTTRE